MIFDTPKVAIFRALTRYVHSDLSLYTWVGVAVKNFNPIRIDHVTLWWAADNRWDPSCESVCPRSCSNASISVFWTESVLKNSLAMDFTLLLLIIQYSNSSISHPVYATSYYNLHNSNDLHNNCFHRESRPKIAKFWSKTPFRTVSECLQLFIHIFYLKKKTTITILFSWNLHWNFNWWYTLQDMAIKQLLFVSFDALWPSQQFFSHAGLQIYGGLGSLSHNFKIWLITFQGSGPSGPILLRCEQISL